MDNNWDMNAYSVYVDNSIHMYVGINNKTCTFTPWQVSSEAYTSNKTL